MTVATVLGIPLLKASPGLSAFWETRCGPWGHILLMVSTHKCNALSTHASPQHTPCHHFCSVRCDSKSSVNFFFLLHNVTLEVSFLP